MREIGRGRRAVLKAPFHGPEEVGVRGIGLDDDGAPPACGVVHQDVHLEREERIPAGFAFRLFPFTLQEKVEVIEEMDEDIVEIARGRGLGKFILQFRKQLIQGGMDGGMP